MSFQPTDEQQAIIDAVAAGKNVTIEAGAGTGKTKTMQLIAEALPSKKILYGAFNKSIAEEAKQKMPRNTECRTVHSLAFRQVGVRYKQRLNGPRQPARETAYRLGITSPERIAGVDLRPATIARLASETVEKFCNSDDDELRWRHVPQVNGLDMDTDRDASAALKRLVLPYAQEIWSDLHSTDDDGGGLFRFTHGAYRKFYALQRPRLPYDVIVLDEAQDSAPVVAELLLNQPHAQVICVGDAAQQIYCQPLGTQVAVAAEVDVAQTCTDDPERQCTFDGCLGQIANMMRGLCSAHDQQRAAGKELKPRATRNLPKKDPRHVPIEDIRVGDRVVTYSNSHVFKEGREVTGVTRFPYEGRLVRVTTDSGNTSAYTPKHHCVVRAGRDLDNKYVVYLMRQGNRFRIGRTPFRYKSQQGGFGLSLRARSEFADAAWILSLHETEAESSLAENLAQYRFNIPGVTFTQPNGGSKNQLNVETFWNKVGDSTYENGARCLEEHGLLLEFPLYERGGSPAGIRRPFVTAAANLIDGFKVFPLNSTRKGGHSNLANWTPADAWESISVSHEWYSGEIVSLEVDDHHTYFGDGLLTHNSFAGASMEAIRSWPTDVRLKLTQSFRFGREIAGEANKWLQLLSQVDECDMRISGTGTSVVGPVQQPDAVLCRTNGMAANEVMRAQAAGIPVSLVGGGDDIKRLAQACQDMKTGKESSHPELVAFKDWSEVQDFVQYESAGADLKAFVQLIDTQGPESVITAMDRLTSESRAQQIVSTSHRGKGREFPSVRIAGDFEEPLDADGEPTDPSPEEVRLAYVAVTRAQNHLDPGGLNWINERAQRKQPQRSSAVE